MTIGLLAHVSLCRRFRYRNHLKSMRGHETYPAMKLPRPRRSVPYIYCGLLRARHRQGLTVKPPGLMCCCFRFVQVKLKGGIRESRRRSRSPDKYGFLGNIRERISEEYHNAEKRVQKGFCGVEIGNSLFYDLNPFRVVLAALWVGGLLWLMPDRLIAKFLSSKGVLVTRQAVSNAVEEMSLAKHKAPLVKSIGNNFQLRFVEGYSPKS